MLGGRPGGLIARALLEPGQYVAVARMTRRYPAFADVLKRYLLGGGDYPYACRVRTPTGIVAPVTYTHHDIFTVQEVFGREDYRAGDRLRVAVDIGSNIGISALYFLTRNRDARCYLYEPVPRNVERLRANLAGYEGRYELEEVAVAADGGTVTFTVEPFGRYGGIGIELVRRATDAVRDAGCEWLHVDFEPELRAFYLDACGFQATDAGLIRLRQP